MGDIMSLLDLIRKRPVVDFNAKASSPGELYQFSRDTPVAIDQSPKFRHWIVHYPDGDVESVFCPPIGFEELMRLDGKAVSAEPLSDLNTNMEVMSYERAHMLKDPEMHGCDDCMNLSSMGICSAATRLGAMPGYRPVLGRRLDHRCPEWKPP